MNLKHALRNIIGQYPWLYFSTYGLKPKNKRLGVAETTELVIEGFPRSANTFAIAAFESHSVPLAMAHHLHVPAQIIRGVKLGKPCIVLIREPKAAVASLLIRQPELDARQALSTYIAFYKPLKKFKADVIVATFEEVTTDYAAVIDKVNKRFGTDFPTIEHTQAFTEKVFDYIENLKEDLEQGIAEHRVARPSEERAKLKENVMEQIEHPSNQKYLQAAQELHHFFVD